MEQFHNCIMFVFFELQSGGLLDIQVRILFLCANKNNDSTDLENLLEKYFTYVVI